MIGPALEEISDELADKVTIAKMDIMENTDVPGQIWRAVDPADGAVQGWQAGRAEAGRRAQEPAQGLAGKRSLKLPEAQSQVSSHKASLAAPIRPGRWASSTR
jgi:hypothetical protein